MKLIFLIFLIATLFIGCKNSKDKETIVKEIADVEMRFQEMTVKKGIPEAFYFFADQKAVIKRENDTLIVGKDNIRVYHSKKGFQNAQVVWTPDFIEVSNSGDMAYTYGKYLWKVKDDKGNVQEYKGVFHTVWKRQENGSWKYVWD